MLLYLQVGVVFLCEMYTVLYAREITKYKTIQITINIQIRSNIFTNSGWGLQNQHTKWGGWTESNAGLNFKIVIKRSTGEAGHYFSNSLKVRTIIQTLYSSNCAKSLLLRAILWHM